jgi:photosystem II Psb27 protein
MRALLSRISARADSWISTGAALGAVTGRLLRGMSRGLLLTCLCVGLALGGCSSANGPLSGNYVDDTLNVARSLLATIELPQDDPERAGAESEARALITSYMARYRPQRNVNGLASFTTMQTALNSLAGHYATYANRPLPDALRTRLEKELHKAESSVQRGA